MMPFIIGEDDTIPVEYQGYLGLIDSCRVPSEERGKTYYLTVQESMVEEGHFHRRPGIHTDKHATHFWGNGQEGGGVDRLRCIHFMHHWGGFGGIYMASTVANSCAVWDAYIEDPGLMGDCEDKREELGEPHLMAPSTLYWMTDGTPYESLAMDKPTYRQFFRLVTSDVDLWYSQHSTANPLGVQPGGKIVTENKFEYEDDGALK